MWPEEEDILESMVGHTVTAVEMTGADEVVIVLDSGRRILITSGDLGIEVDVGE